MSMLLVIILHYGPEDETHKCIASLTSEPDLDIVIADNDPSQGFTLLQQHQRNARVIRTGGLASFAEGNNLAADAFLTQEHDSILILNNDTIATQGSISLLRNTLSMANVGAVGPCMPYLDSPDRVWACGGKINPLTLSVKGHPTSFSSLPYDVDYLPGAAILCHSSIWRQLGGLPDNYYLAYEEAEFATRIKRLGFRVVVNPASRILHKVGMSSQAKPEYYYNSVRNRIIFAKFLYGTIFGVALGIAATTMQAIASGIRSGSPEVLLLKCSLLAQGIIDEIKGVKIDGHRLSAIRQRYQRSIAA